MLLRRPVRRSRPRTIRSTVLAAGLAVSLGAAVLAPTGSSVAADDDRPAPWSLAGERLLTVDFDGQDRTLDPGEQFTVSGTVRTVVEGASHGLPRLGDGVPASFTLEVTDVEDTVLGSQEVTAADDGSFATTVPGELTRGLAVGDEPVQLAVRAVDAAYDGYRAARAGAQPVQLRGRAKGLRIQNSFVSAVGWVKPGESYPSRILLTNPTKRRLRGAVTVTAPRGTTFVRANGPGRKRVAAHQVTWRPRAVKPGRTATLVLLHRAATLKKLPTLVWRDLSTKAKLRSKKRQTTVVSHGPRVIPPSERFDTARYGDRPFPVIPVQYTDRPYHADHSGQDLRKVINSRKHRGSTFNLFQEMSLRQLFPQADVPSASIATAGFNYKPGFPFRKTDTTSPNTCHGVTFGDSPVPVQGTPVYRERITRGVYNLPGSTEWYGSDANGSALVGAIGGIGALQDIDSGCGPAGKIVWDAAALADPEVDYSDFDTDKDGVVDFFMAVFAGCGGNGASQIPPCSSSPRDMAPYDNVWPHSSSLEYYYTDPKTGLAGFTTDDQLKDLQGRKLYYTNKQYQKMTTRRTPYKVFVRVGPYNLNPETAIDKASVISHEYGHSLGLPDFYSTGSRETYGDWNLMATDKSQNMDAFSRQELGWVVPEVLGRGRTLVKRFPDSKQDVGVIHWRTPSGKRYTLRRGRDGVVHNSRMYVAKLPGRQLLDPAKFATGDKATKTHAWFSGSGNDFGCNADGGGHNLDISVPGLSKLPANSTVTLSMKSAFDIEWDYDYGFVLTSSDGGKTYRSNASTREPSTTTPAATNPNQNTCQAEYGNGITGSSASYTNAANVQADRTLSNYPPSIFLADSFDISDLAGAQTPVIRLSYSTDPGLARPGWFIDDVKVVATTPGGQRRVLYRTDFEKSGGPDDPHIFNGGCQADNPGGNCTQGWQYVKAGAEADFDHAYYLEMRDRSGFDLDGNGQIDRSPIGWVPGLYLAYTDEAHGYGNAGTDDPPAQSPLDSRPEPGDGTPNLDDAAFTAAKFRRAFSDFGVGHTDNYEDPSNTRKDPRYSDVANPWRFTYDCLRFKVLRLRGGKLGPERSNGDLTGRVRFTTGRGCGKFDYGYAKPIPRRNTPPVARIRASDDTVAPGTRVRFNASRSTDRQTPTKLDYVWSWGNGGKAKDAYGVRASHVFKNAGTYRVRLLVTDPQGRSDTATVTIRVR